jgi:hypothetical protein
MDITDDKEIKTGLGAVVSLGDLPSDLIVKILRENQ